MVEQLTRGREQLAQTTGPRARDSLHFAIEQLEATFGETDAPAESGEPDLFHKS
jgi:hypothetical protein